MIAVADIVRRVGIIVQDTEHTRTTTPEIIDWINDAAAAIIDIRPHAGATTITHTCTSGALQTLAGLQVLDVTRNLPTGIPITRTDRFQLDAIDPEWYAGDQSASIQHYTIDDRNPRQTYVYPPAVAGTELEALVAQLPTKVIDTDDDLDMEGNYMHTIVSYVVYRAMSKDSEYADGALALQNLNAFNQAMGLKTQSANFVSPNRGAP